MDDAHRLENMGADRRTGDGDSSAGPLAGALRRIDRPIVLVGLMGVGKSTVGRRLANVLDTPFIDADDAIAEAAQMSIPEIFEQFGETYFRDGERRVIARLIEEQAGRPAVIATGGGAFVDPETRAMILERAIAVWLDAKVDVLVERVGRKQNRPLLTGRDPRQVLTRLLHERGPAYAQAQIRITSDDGPHSQSVTRILDALTEYLS